MGTVAEKVKLALQLDTLKFETKELQDRLVDARTQDSTGFLSVSDAHNWWVVRVRTVSDVLRWLKKECRCQATVISSSFMLSCHVSYTFELHVVMSLVIYF